MDLIHQPGLPRHLKRIRQERAQDASVTRGEWVVGHDQRAIHARIRDDFGGSVSRFIDWYDSHGPFATPS